MKKRVFIIHQWKGTPKSDWYQWLAAELKKQGFEVSIPEMPDPIKPKIIDWIETMRYAIGSEDKDTHLIGHSIGCQAIIRYLTAMAGNDKVGNVLLVAPWLHLKEASYETDDDRMVAKPWLETSIEWNMARRHATKFEVIMAKEDPYVPVEDAEIFKQKLGAKAVIMPLKTHFTSEEGYGELHVALNEFLNMFKE